MKLEPELRGAASVWALPGGEAVLDGATGRWTRPGLHSELIVDGARPTLHVDLDAGDVLAVLDPPVLVPPNTSRLLRLAWPLVLTLMQDDRPLDRWRPTLRRGLWGSTHAGMVIDAVRARQLHDDEVPAAYEGAVRVVLTSRHAAPIIATRVVVPEDGLDLWSGPDGVMLGDVRVDLLAPDRATARPENPTLPGDATLVGRRLTKTPPLRSSMFGWSAPSARAVVFEP